MVVVGGAVCGLSDVVELPAVDLSENSTFRVCVVLAVGLYGAPLVVLRLAWLSCLGPVVLPLSLFPDVLVGRPVADFGVATI